MSETNIITVRDSDIVAAEINTIKEDTRRIMIANAIRIGGKLLEAKSMVPFGEWGKWLEEKVAYSQSTADNMMKLYREYGENQESLFDTWTNSQAFANLSYTQHLALLALPFSQRQEFAEANNVEAMTTRELQEAVRDHNEDSKARETAEARVAELEAELEAAKLHNSDQENEALLNTMKSRAEVAESNLARAEKSEQNALALVKKLEKQLATAKAGEEAATASLKKLKENPEIPEAVMAQMRQQVAEEAAKKAAEDLKKQLDTAKQKLKEANEQAAQEREKAAAAQKQLQLASPDAAVFKTLFHQVQEDFNRLSGALLKIRTADPALADKLSTAVRAMLDQQGKALEAL